MKRAQTTGPKMVIFTPLLGQIGGLLGQWPTRYNIKKCPVEISIALGSSSGRRCMENIGLVSSRVNIRPIRYETTSRKRDLNH